MVVVDGTSVDASADTREISTRAPVSDVRADYRRGDAIGRYVVLGTLGSGGMSVVYDGYDPELERKVAIKVLQPCENFEHHSDSWNDSQMRSRLLREAQALARLSHPNVLPVYDVGTIDGRVFMAMEHVQGVTLDQWLEIEPRSWREVVGAFVQAGHGLAAAHAAGLVHRDFKPQNVLVGKDGSVRVMDFGLVQVNDATTEESPAFDDTGSSSQITGRITTDSLTKLGTIMGTPAYMAPEQHRGDPVDAAADQYAFCVALYQALYGHRPFSGPSRELLHAKENLALDEHKSSSSHLIPRRLHKLVLRGMDPRPQRRFASMDQLLGLLERDPSRTRRRMAVTVGLVVVTALGGVAYGKLSGPGVLLCAGGESEIDEVWNDDRADHLQRAFADTDVSWAPDTWNKIDPVIDAYSRAWANMHREACEATRVRGEQSDALLDLRMACLDRRKWALDALLTVFENPDRTVVEKAVGAVHGLPPLDRCADLEALQSGKPLPSDPATRRRVEKLSEELARVRALTKAGRIQSGLTRAKEIVEQAEELGDDPLLAEALFRQGRLEYLAGDFSASEGSLREASWRADSSGADEVAADAKSQLLFLTGYHLAKPTQAEVWANAARGAVGRLDQDLERKANYLNNLAVSKSVQNHHEEAYPLFQESADLMERALGSEHPKLVETYGNLAIVSMLVGKMEDARGHATRAIALGDRVLGPKHTEIAYPLLTRAALSTALADYDRALADADRAQRLIEDNLGSRNPYLSITLRNKANIFIRTGAHDRAEAVLDWALQIDTTKDGRKTGVASDHVYFALMREAQGRLEEALDHAEKAVSILEPIEGGNMELPKAHAVMGRALMALQRPEEARPYLEQSLRGSEGDTEHDGYAALDRFALARALWATGGDRRRARELAKDALRRLERHVKEPMHRRRRPAIRSWLDTHPL